VHLIVTKQFFLALVKCSEQEKILFLEMSMCNPYWLTFSYSFFVLYAFTEECAFISNNSQFSEYHCLCQVGLVVFCSQVLCKENMLV